MRLTRGHLLCRFVSAATARSGQPASAEAVRQPATRPRTTEGTNVDDSTDVAPNTEPAGGTTPQGTPGQTPQPSGDTVQVSKAEYERLTQDSTRYRGAAPMITRMVQAGIKTPEDVDRYRSIAERAARIGVDLDQMLNALDRGGQPAAPQPEADPQYLTMDTLNATLAERDARARYEAELRAESDGIARLAETLHGPNATEAQKRAARALVADIAYEGATVYQDGPLRGQPRPVVDFGNVEKQAREVWREFTGKQLVDLANAKPMNAGVAGSVTQGNANTAEDRPDIPFYELPREAQESIVRAKMAESAALRGGAPVSSFAGATS